MSDKTVTVRTGFGFFSLLTIVFVTLKLAEIGAVAHWSWLAVLSPMLIGPVFAIGLLLMVSLFAVLVAVIGSRR